MDEEFPRSMPDHDVRHVVELGWQGKKNGVLLALAGQAGFEAFVTADKNMPYQQNMKGRPLSLVVLDIHPNTIESQVACIPALDTLFPSVEPGKVYVVEGPHPKRTSR